MKTNIKITSLVILPIAILCSALTAHAASSPAEVTKTVAPLVSEQEVGKTIKVKLHIDQSGKVTSAEALDLDDYDELLAQRLIKAVKEWEFNPSKDDQGRNQACVLIVPVHIASIAQP